MVSGYQHGPMWLTRPWASTEHSVATVAMDTIPVPTLSRTTDMALGREQCPSLSMATGGSISHLVQHSPKCGMVLRYQYGSKASQTLIRHMVIVGTLGHHFRPCLLDLDIDMTLCSSFGLEETMALGDSAGHLDQDVPSGTMALRCPHGHRLQPRPQVSLWPLVAICAPDINTIPN